MLKFIIGFFLGAIFTFALCFAALVAKDERDIKRRKLHNETGAFWHNKKERNK